MAVYKPFTTLLCFVNEEYYRGVESGLIRLEMALFEVFDILYVVDILNYIIIDDSWGIGVRNYKYYDEEINSMSY